MLLVLSAREDSGPGKSNNLTACKSGPELLTSKLLLLGVKK